MDFNSLQQRMTTSTQALTASFAAFDLLAVAGHDIRIVPLSARLDLLDELAGKWAAPLNLSPTTMDRELAVRWFEEMAAVGVVCLVISPLLNECVDAIHQGNNVVHEWRVFLGAGGAAARPATACWRVPLQPACPETAHLNHRLSQVHQPLEFGRIVSTMEPIDSPACRACT